MSDSQAPDPEPVRYILTGATPALIGTGIILIHLRDPIVSDGHQAILAGAWVCLIGWAIATWQHYHRRRSLARTEAAQANIMRAIRALDQHTEEIGRHTAALGQAFIEEGMPDPRPSSQRRGPRLLH